MIDIKYIDGGNAVEPQGDGLKYIIHVVNDIGAWGSGFVLAISKKWAEPERSYRNWATNDTYQNPASNFKLGQIREVKVEDDISIINMIGQRNIGKDIVIVGDITNTIYPIRYEAIRECLMRVAALAKNNNASIHCPKFGAGLAMGDWTKIAQLIHEQLSCCDIPVTVYNYT